MLLLRVGNHRHVLGEGFRMLIKSKAHPRPNEAADERIYRPYYDIRHGCGPEKDVSSISTYRR